MSAHASPEQIRKNLSHPVIDGDGHWIEYTPVFAEKIRKVAQLIRLAKSFPRRPRLPSTQSHGK